jgi:hypothetical protein
MTDFLKRVLGVLLAVALAVAAFLFVSIALAVALAASLALGAVLWWRGRRAGPLGAGPQRGIVIEGEYRVEREDARLERRAP